MPTYQYICNNCNYEFEDFHSICEMLEECPKCHKISLIRLIGTGSNIIFKGDGWTLPSKETKGVIDEN